MSILGEYLQRVKAERAEAVNLLRQTLPWVEGSFNFPEDLEAEIVAFLSRYDLPDDYDEA